MKKAFLALASFIAAIILLPSCSGEKEKKAVPTDTLEVPVDTDTVPENDNIPFETQEFSKVKGENKLEIEYPTSGNPELLFAIRSWINEQLTDTYTGDLNSAEAFFKHYAAQLGEDPDLNEFGGYTIDEFDVEYKNDIIVTYSHTSYEYEGGAHGLGGEYGTTFLQKDGSIFNRKCITSYKAIHGLIVDGLKKYFKVKSDADLMAQLMNGTAVSSIAPPALDPWIDEDGVTFSYTPYEIAPYSAGSPHFTIPYEKIEPYLTEEGKQFFAK